jgi:hypothetical protein
VLPNTHGGKLGRGGGAGSEVDGVGVPTEARISVRAAAPSPLSLLDSDCDAVEALPHSTTRVLAANGLGNDETAPMSVDDIVEEELAALGQTSPESVA